MDAKVKEVPNMKDESDTGDAEDKEGKGKERSTEEHPDDKQHINDTEDAGDIEDEDTDAGPLQSNPNEWTIDIFNNIVRMTIRFLLVFKDGTSTDSTDSPFDHLLSLPLSPLFEQIYRAVANLVRELIGTAFTQVEVEKWVCMVRDLIPISAFKTTDQCRPAKAGDRWQSQS